MLTKPCHKPLLIQPIAFLEKCQKSAFNHVPWKIALYMF